MSFPIHTGLCILPIAALQRSPRGRLAEILELALGDGVLEFLAGEQFLDGLAEVGIDVLVRTTNTSITPSSCFSMASASAGFRSAARRVVARHQSHINGVQGTGQLCSIDRFDFEVLRIGCDIVDRGLGGIDFALERHQTLLLEHAERTCQVRAIVRDCDRSSVFDVIDGLVLVGIDAQAEGLGSVQGRSGRDCCRR